MAVDYSGDVPTIAAKVQEFFGVTQGPLIAGEPVQLMLLSPADRPIQITSDLGGFWTGSWADARKDMAGRYPKHEWPEDPGTRAQGASESSPGDSPMGWLGLVRRSRGGVAGTQGRPLLVA